MVNEFLMNRVNTAHSLLDEGQVEGALWVLRNIKLRIHDPNVINKIKDKEKTVENEYKTRYSSISGDATRQMEQLSDLNLWRIKEYISFYDQILREHERL